MNEGNRERDESHVRRLKCESDLEGDVGNEERGERKEE